jgi:hypothetical protein
MAFTRKFLIENGVPEDKVDAIMAERNRTLTDYIPKEDADKAVQEAISKLQKANPTESDEYKTLSAKYSKLEAFNSDDFSSVKKPYRDMVWEHLDHGDKHKEYSEQIAEMQKTMPDLFNAAEPQKEEPKPNFGAPTEGTMPSGKTGPAFMDTWNFVPKKG